MSLNEFHTGCGCCSHTRRSFLAGCAGCLGASALPGLLIPTSFAADNAAPNGKFTLRVIFALWGAVQPRPTWPNIGFDFNPVMAQTMDALTNGCKDIHFVSSMASDPENAQKIIDADKAAGNVDGYIVMQMNNWPNVVTTVVESGKPVLFADFLFAGSGGFLRYTATLIRAKKPNFTHISSGRISDLVAAANCFPLAKKQGGLQAFTDAVAKLRTDAEGAVAVNMKCLDDKVDVLSTSDLLKELKTKRLLEFEQGRADFAPETKKSLGIDITRCSFAELNGLWEKADKDHAQEIVNRWKNTAAAITDVSEDTLEKSARMYLAMKQCMKNHDACGITINCLGGFYSNKILAYPCLGFHELLNEGLIGACECDTLSTITMVVMTTLTQGRPGYISDPVMDMAAKQVIYAHCVAPSKAFGPKGLANAYSIMTHSEDRQGASVRSTLPVGYMTTTLEIHPLRKEILFHQAKTVANSTEDRACRTKVAAVPIGDYEKLYREWDQWSWHRVTYYGDLRESILALGEALGWKVTQEA